MKVLVTGGTGFVGKQLLMQLRDKGHECVVLTRNPGLAGVRLPVACHIVGWDPLAGPPPEEAFAGVEAVIHLAGENVAGGRWTESRKRAISESRIISSRHLVERLNSLEQKPEVLVSASAVGFYGDRGNEELSETSSLGSGFLPEVCRQWEDEVFRAEASGIRTVALRIGIVLGHDGGAMQKMLPAFRLGLGGPLGGGKQWMSWIHVRDLAGLAVSALETPGLQGPVNAVSPHPVTNGEFTRILGKTLCRPTLLGVPASLLRLIFGEMSQILLASQKVSAVTARESGYKFVYPKLDAALKVICAHFGHELLMEQWVPQPLEQVFEFFSNAKNLEILTPPFLKFKVLKVSPETMGDGMKLDYRLTLHGITFRWQSTITDWNPPVRFSDFQSKGPYALWHHTHEFFEKDGGTVIRDKAIYKLPGWIPGDVAAYPFVRKDLETIFSYRRDKIIEMFGSD